MPFSPEEVIEAIAEQVKRRGCCESHEIVDRIDDILIEYRLEEKRKIGRDLNLHPACRVCSARETCHNVVKI